MAFSIDYSRYKETNLTVLRFIYAEGKEKLSDALSVSEKITQRTFGFFFFITLAYFSYLGYFIPKIDAQFVSGNSINFIQNTFLVISTALLIVLYSSQLFPNSRFRNGRKPSDVYNPAYVYCKNKSEKTSGLKAMYVSEIIDLDNRISVILKENAKRNYHFKVALILSITIALMVLIVNLAGSL